MSARRVLVAGATGFIGGAVSRHLVARGFEVHAVYRADGRPPDPALAGVRWHVHDGTDVGMRRLVTAVVPDTIVHLAAFMPTGDPDEPIEALVRGNVLFGTQLLAAAIAADCRRIVHTGTYWEYLHGTQAVSLYAALKQAFGRVLQYYCDAHDVRAITLALYDTYGAGDPRGKFVTLLRDAAMTGVTLDASDGHQTIDLVHIDDVARAYAVALDLVPSLPKGAHRTYAVRSGQARSLRALADAVHAATGRPVPVNWGARPRRPRTPDSPPDIPRLPGWEPERSLDTDLADLIGTNGHD